VGNSSIIDNAAKQFCILILATSLNILHNYFDKLLKLFSDLCLAKFLNMSEKFVRKMLVGKLLAEVL